MKRLYLLRHAKSGWDDPVARDFDRPLNARGRRGAETLGRYLKGQGFSVDRVVASPAVRVVETLESLAVGFGSRFDPRWDKRIYLASAPALLELVHELDDASDSAMLVGHNPGFEDLVLALVPDQADSARASVEEKFPTAALVEIHFDVDHWREVDDGGGRIAQFIRPRDLDPALGPSS